jgi:hypothetical protein
VAKKSKDQAPTLMKLFKLNESTEPLLEMPHWEFSASDVPELQGTVDFQMEKYLMPQEEKKRLINAFFTTGVVGKGKDGKWLFLSSGAKGQKEVAPATDEQVEKLPQLPEGWLDLVRTA